MSVQIKCAEINILNNSLSEGEGKYCHKCEIKKMYSAFNKNKNNYDGYQEQCRLCVKEYYKNNKAQLKEYSRKYQQDHKEQYLVYMKEYHVKNRESDKEKRRERYTQIREKEIQQVRAYQEKN